MPITSVRFPVRWLVICALADTHGHRPIRVCDARDVSERIHDDEPDTSAPVVRSLLEAECPQWAQSPIEYLKTSGTDNAMWRIRIDDGPDVVIRLPRRPGAAAGVLHEAAVLQQIEQTSLGSDVKHAQTASPRRTPRSVPSPLDRSRMDRRERRLDPSPRPRRSTPRRPGYRSRRRRQHDRNRRRSTTHRQRSPGSRGGPLLPLLERLEGWLHSAEWNAAALLDVAAVRRLAAEALEVVDEPVIEGFVHGDLIPGNLLVDEGRLTAIIDWGGAGWGDTAQDLAPAWAVLTAAERSAFRGRCRCRRRCVDSRTDVRTRTRSRWCSCTTCPNSIPSVT